MKSSSNPEKEHRIPIQKIGRMMLKSLLVLIRAATKSNFIVNSNNAVSKVALRTTSVHTRYTTPYITAASISVSNKHSVVISTATNTNVWFWSARNRRT